MHLQGLTLFLDANVFSCPWTGTELYKIIYGRLITVKNSKAKCVFIDAIWKPRKKLVTNMRKKAIVRDMRKNHVIRQFFKASGPKYHFFEKKQNKSDFR